MNLFKDSPTTFAPIDLAPAPKDYVIGPGDELRFSYSEIKLLTDWFQ